MPSMALAGFGVLLHARSFEGEGAGGSAAARGAAAQAGEGDGQVYSWAGLERVPEIRRVLEVAVADTLSLENSPARSRTLGYLASLSLRALEVGELEERVAALERAVQGQGRGR